MDDLIQRLRVEPTASQFLRIGDLVESLVAERKEAADRIAALEAEKAERERELTEVKSVLYDEIDGDTEFSTHDARLRESDKMAQLEGGK